MRTLISRIDVTSRGAKILVAAALLALSLGFGVATSTHGVEV